MFGECHAHILMNGYNYKEAVELHRGRVDEKTIRRWFLDYQKSGVTFIRDGGDALGVSVRAKEIAGEYGIDYRTPVFAVHKNGHYGGIVGRGYSSMEEYCGLIDEAIERGADFIKIMVSGILDFSCCSKIMCGDPLDEEEISRMIEEVHRRGYSVMVHANGKKAVMAAAAAGADSIEHGNYIDKDTLLMMRKKNVIWVPTLATIRNLKGSGRYPDTEIVRIYRLAAENVKSAFGLGVQLALGSDAGAYMVPHGEGIKSELAAFEEILGKDEKVYEYLRSGENMVRQRFSPCPNGKQITPRAL